MSVSPGVMYGGKPSGTTSRSKTGKFKHSRWDGMGHEVLL